MTDHRTYDPIIAQKLNELPLPDMADAIWARIEAQLDIDLPGDAGGGGAPPSSPSGRWTGGLGIFLGALLLTFFLIKTDHPSQPASLPATAPLPGAAAPQDAPRSPEDNRDKSPAPTRTVLPAAPPGGEGPLPPGTDSETAQRSAQPVDSQQAVTVVLPPPVTRPDSVGKKPGRGVPGISDSDYRIVPAKKDSS